MMKKIMLTLAAGAATLMLSVINGYSYSSYGDNVNSACDPVTPYTGDCMLCHTSGSKKESTEAMVAYSTGGTALTDFFCPTEAPACTDNDGDGYAVEGGDCGAVDCNDNDAAINPGAVENCSDVIDNNCNDLVDEQDPAAVGCLVCTDGDGDGFAAEGGDCGLADCNDSDSSINPDAFDTPNNGIDEDCSGADAVDPTGLDNDGDGFSAADGDCNDNDAAIYPNAVDIPNNGIDENCDGADSVDTTLLDNDGDGFTQATGDCDDTNAAINPEAVESCTDTIDNNCNGLVDVQDPDATGCPVSCTDNDGDGYATDGGECGPVDCNDSDPAINPGGEEVCGDIIDNDCDGIVDEACDTNCPDLDGDGYLDAACGGADCDDTNASINPGSVEVCGNAVDENCNGGSDDVCLTCPDGSLLVIKGIELEGNLLKLRGRATNNTELAVINTDTGEILDDDIPVRRGAWQVEIETIDSSLAAITVISSDGCAVDQVLDVGGANNGNGGGRDKNKKK